MSDDLVKKNDDLTKKLKGTLQASSLKDLVQEHKAEKETFILLDYSSSMDGAVSYSSSTRKIDALREVAKELREDVTSPQVGFGGYTYDSSKAHPGVRFITQIPNPAGGTPLAEAIRFSKLNGAKRLIVVSDGEPDDDQDTLKAAAEFGGPIDVFYVGPEHGPGQEFMQKLARATKGRIQVTTLKDTKQIAGKIKGYLGAGTPQLGPARGSIKL